jgi:hypothetical protein
VPGFLRLGRVLVHTREIAGVIYLARGKWWLVLAIIAADLIIATFIGDRLIRWELEQIREAW